MDEQFVVDTLRTLDARTTRVEQVLPSLATREFVKTAIADAVAPLATRQELAEAIAPLATRQELADAIAPLATKQELADAVAPLATKQELRESFEELRRHFYVVGESLRDDIRLLAEGIVDVKADVRALRGDVKILQEDVAVLKVHVAVLQRDRL